MQIIEASKIVPAIDINVWSNNARKIMKPDFGNV